MEFRCRLVTASGEIVEGTYAVRVKDETGDAAAPDSQRALLAHYTATDRL